MATKEVHDTIARIRLGLALAVVLAACETAAPAATEPSPSERPGAVTGPPSSPSPTTTVRVAFVQDLAPEEALDTTLPSLQAIELAFATSAASGRVAFTVEVVAFDTQGDPAALDEVAAEIAQDAAYVAAFAAPNLGGISALVETLAAVRVPLFSLSARDRVEDAPPGTWLRFVAPLDVQALALAERGASLRPARRGVCLVTAPTDGTTFFRKVRRELSARVRLVEASDAGDVAAGGCGAVVWTGGDVGGAALAVRLQDAATVLVGGPGLRGRDFLGDAGPAAQGAVSFCSCADVSTSLGLGARRFIQDYQSEFGSPPGPYAVEAWDAAHMLISALRGAGPLRESVAAWLAATPRFDGLGRTYAFAGGELSDPMTAIHVYRVKGGRWVLAESVRR